MAVMNVPPARSPSSSIPAEVSRPRASVASACPRAVVRREYDSESPNWLANSLSRREWVASALMRARPRGHNACDRHQPAVVDAARDGVDPAIGAARIGSERARESALVGRIADAAVKRRAGRVPPAAGRPPPSSARSRRSRRSFRSAVSLPLKLSVVRRSVDAPQCHGPAAPDVAAAARNVSKPPPSSDAEASGAPLLPRNDPDHRPDRIRSVECALRSADDLDPLDVRDRQVREVVAAAERVGLHAVDHHQRIVGLAATRKHARERAAAAVGRRPTSPAPARSASATLSTWCFSRSSRVMTVTLDEAADSGISTCAAETTTDSDTALIFERDGAEVALGARRR